MNQTTFIEFIDVRPVDEESIFIPKHTKNGKQVMDMCEFKVRHHHAKDPKRHDVSKIIAFGTLAAVCAKSVSPGRNLEMLCCYTHNEAFILKFIVFGPECRDVVLNQILGGFRPGNWDNPNHPDYVEWLRRCKLLTAYEWDGKSGDFGYAKVVLPA